MLVERENELGSAGVGGGEILSRKKYLTSIVCSKGVLGTPQSKTKACNETYVGLLSEISVIIFSL